MEKTNQNSGIIISGGTITAGNIVVGNNSSAHKEDNPDDCQSNKNPKNNSNTRKKDYDIFISYAFEDKDNFAAPLSEKLQQLGLTVWFDNSDITAGDDLKKKIDDGVSKSLIMAIVLSEHYIRKDWTNYELDAAISQKDEQNILIIPIYHGVKVAEVRKYSPFLANKVACDSQTQTLDQIVAEINKARIKIAW